MKRLLLQHLICPECLPNEVTLEETVFKEENGDMLAGRLSCPCCKTDYPVENGIACLLPKASAKISVGENKYELSEVVSSYLWSHYADLLNEENTADAYTRWAAKISPFEGLAIDAGAAVGRLTFDMAQKGDLAVGLDTSMAFIRTARFLMMHGCMDVALKEEGDITRTLRVQLPVNWRRDNVEFIVADAMALPFRQSSAAVIGSLNLVDKVPAPYRHLTEANRVAMDSAAQFLLSDPFSWSETSAKKENWLGGLENGPFAGRGVDNIVALLSAGNNDFMPAWDIQETGKVWWRIRTHANHFEQIQSQWLLARR